LRRKLDLGHGPSLDFAALSNHVRREPSELCGALLLFVSPAGRWITGQVMIVDGGIVPHT
jgi:hypothetical protein